MRHSVASLTSSTDLYVSRLCVPSRPIEILTCVSLQLFLSFYRMEVARIDHSVRIVDSLMREFLPDLRDHFAATGVRMDMFLIDWCAVVIASGRMLTSNRVLTLFTKSMPIDISTRVWDIYFVDGEIVIYLVILGVLAQLQTLLLSLSFEGIIKTLCNLQVHHRPVCLLRTHPSQHLNEDDLFEQIESLSNYLSQSRFQEICKLCS